MLSGEKEFSMDTITEITVDTLVSGTTQAGLLAAGWINI